MPAPTSDEAALHRTADHAWTRLQNFMNKQQVKINIPLFGGWRAALTSVFGIFICTLVVGSYIITQSSRSGDGDASLETNLIGRDSFDDYPAGVRTVVVRMIVDGVAPENLRFNQPENLNALYNAMHGVFSPSGGGARYALAPAKVMASGRPGVWYFNMNIALTGIGSDAGDIIAYLPGVAKAVCEKINNELGIDGIPMLSRPISQFYTHTMTDMPGQPYQPPARPRARISQVQLAGKSFGCFQDYGVEKYTYFHTLVER